MAEMSEQVRALESTTVGIYRTATVVKGGRRFSFSAMVVMGDRHGSIGLGYGKGRGVPAAIEKAEKNARKSLCQVTLKSGTLPHPVIGKFGASIVKLIPASPGTGVIAGGTARAVLEMVGVRDCLTKAYGSTNQKNLCKATIEGLRQLRSKEQIADLRGVEIPTSVVEQILEAGEHSVASAGSGQAKVKGPVNTFRTPGTRGHHGRGGGGRGGGRGGSSPPAPQAEPAARSQPVEKSQAVGPEPAGGENVQA